MLLPFYKISIWILVVQGIIAIYLFTVAGKLFATWDEKKRKIEILVSKNRAEFRPETFRVFIDAPCGRLLVRSVLSELGKSNEYGNLLKMRKPLLTAIKENCTPAETVIYINEEALTK